MATKLTYAQALKSPPPSLMEASSGETLNRLAPAKKPKGARRNTLSPKSGKVQKDKVENQHKEKNAEQLSSDNARKTKSKVESNKKGADCRRTLSPQRPGHAQTSELPKPAGRKDPKPAIKVSLPAGAKHDGLAHKSISLTLKEKKMKSLPC